MNVDVPSVVLGLANAERIPYARQSWGEIEGLVRSTDPEIRMRMFGLREQWTEGRRRR